MALLTEDAPRAASRRVLPLALAVGAVLMIAAGLLTYYCTLRSGPSAPADAKPQASTVLPARPQNVASGSLDVAADVPGARVSLDGKALGAAPRLIIGLAPGAHRLRVELAGYETWEQDAHVIPNVTTKLQARLVRPPARLRVESDVPDASVFLDQKFCGRTPLDLPDLSAGPHRLSVSAEGYDMYEQALDLLPGPKTVSVRFKEVHLDEALDVVHRHTLGSCSGRLVATAAGLRYETPNKKDAFVVPLSGIERIEVDYLGKTLAVKVRGSRTYDFSVKAGTADPLLVFQQKVEKVRQRLAGVTS
jgi:hypothetical protein